MLTAPMSRWHATLLGVATTVLVGIVYLPGADRSLGYDAAETVGFFVLADDAKTALTGQRAFNNHPLFSLIEHLIVRAAGSDSERVLRAFPIFAGAATVGVLVAFVAFRLGPRAAVAAGALTASNPLFVELARSVRGYSLLCLMVILATIALVRSWELEVRSRRTMLVMWGTCIWAGVATHLLMAVVVIAHLAELGRRRALDAAWRITVAITGGASLAFYATRIDDLLSTGDDRGRVFRPWFLFDLTFELLGGSALSVGSAVLLVWLARRRSPLEATALTFACAVGCVVVIAWIVGPEALVPRFFVWAVPGVALVLSVTALRVGRPGITLVTVMIAASVGTVLPGYTDDPTQYHEIVEIMEIASAEGDAVCVPNLSVPPLLAYTTDFEPIVDPSGFGRCDVVVVPHPDLDPDLTNAASDLFANRLVVEPGKDAIVYSQLPLG